MAQVEAISSHPISSFLREEIDPMWFHLPFRELKSNTVSPQTTRWLFPQQPNFWELINRSFEDLTGNAHSSVSHTQLPSQFTRRIFLPDKFWTKWPPSSNSKFSVVIVGRSHKGSILKPEPKSSVTNQPISLRTGAQTTGTGSSSKIILLHLK